jgi:hypothetical protein
MWFALYWLAGAVFMLALVRRLNKGLSIVDMICCVGVGLIWPVVVVGCFFVLLIERDNWLTDPRYFKPKG